MGNTVLLDDEILLTASASRSAEAASNSVKAQFQDLVFVSYPAISGGVHFFICEQLCTVMFG